MSSHREAPEISKDPVADSTDVYAFRSPANPGNVVLIANFIPLQKPDSGPNFFEFGDDVLYEIHVSNKGTAQADISYQFKFKTKVRNDRTFLYNTGQINNIDDESWNRPQSYSVKRVKGNDTTTLGSNLPCPPVNVGKRYVSYHLMCVYMASDLLEAMSPELRSRMQGKSCFNFTKVDDELFDELSAITARGRDLYAARGWLAVPPA